MKKVGLGAGILLLLLVAGALIVPGFIDWNKYKSEIEMTASDLSDRKVTINGDLSLSILPSPSFSAEDVSVSNVEGGQATNFISLKSVDVNVAFFPLLRSEVQVKKFILVEPVIAIEIDENGKGNWEFGTTDDTTDDGGSTTELSFEQFQIENGQISFQDFSTGTQELVRMINASVSMDSLQGPFEVDGSARYKNLPVSTELMVGTIREGRKIPINLAAELLNGDVKVKFSGGILPDDTSPQADGKFNLDADEIGDLFLAVSLLNLENTNQNGPKYNQPLSLESTMAYGGDAINISSVEFEMGESRGSGNVTATFGEFTRFDGNLAVNSFDLDSFLPAIVGDDNATANSENSEDFDYSILDQLEGNFNFKLGALQYNEKIASQLDLGLTATAGGLEVNNAKVNMPGGSEFSLDGVLTAPQNKPEFNGDLTLNSGNFRAFLEWLKIDVSTIPNGRLTRLAYSGGIKADQNLIQFYGIDGNLDTFQFKGGVSYAVQDRPAMGLDVSVSNLNVDNYLASDTDVPFDFKQSVAVLGDFDANYELDLNNITTQGVTVKKIDVSGELFGGRLNARTITVEDYAGFDLNGSLIGSNLSDDPQFETSFNTTAASLLPLQRAFRFKTPYDIAQVGAVAVNARIVGNFEKADVDIKSTIGSSKADLKGSIRSATLKQFPEIGSVDVTLVASSPSLISLIDQFDLPMTKASASDDRPFAINTTLKGTQQLVDIDGTLSVAGGDVALKGRANLVENALSSFDMAIDIKGPQVREFIRGVGIDFRPSNTELGPIELNMAASGTTSDVSLTNIAGVVGPTKITGAGEIKGLDATPEEGRKTSFDFNLVLDDVPTQDFMEAQLEEAAQEWGSWSKEPLELAILNEFEGQATITANRISYDKYDFQNPRFEAVLNDGVISISNFTGKLFGGDVAVAGTFSSGGALDMDMSLKNAAIVDATSSFAGIQPISGYFDMTQKITGNGTSQDALISSLNGTGAITASQGIINGINIPELSERLNDLSNQNGLLRLLSSSLSGGETPYEGGSSIITTKNGFIQLSPLDVNMLGAQSAVDLGINLAQWKMNLDGEMSLSEHPGAPPIGISVLGDLHDPEIAYNTKQLEGFIGQKIAASLLQNMVDGNGGLGGLFGGVEEQNPEIPGGSATPAPEGPTETPAATGPVTSSPLEDFFEPTSPQQPAQEPQNSAPNPVPEQQRESVEELGVKLLERLFQQPPPQD